MIVKMLDLSTAHVSFETSIVLQKAGAGQHVLPFRVINHEYGWLFPVPETTASCLPADLRGVIDQARQQGCAWINFDSDGDDVDGLPTHDDW